MPSQPLGFAELLAGGVLVAAGISGNSIADVVAGKGSPLAKLVDFPTATPTAAGSTLTSLPLGVGGGAASAVGPGGTTNPLPGWSRSRVDQGVDYYGGKVVRAPMGGQVLAVGAPGWPQGSPGTNGVLVRLDNGQIWYWYEGLKAAVHKGERVAAGQVIATAVPGQSIEAGLADAAGVPLSHATYTEGRVTAWGTKALAILRSWGTA